ncbi:MAG: RagB/SusD family nutrient uptake outer membrane protein [Bacteroidales bacterium]|nr:RagB/SusD family nutrient uptake outer membrane protein [Bacteroidales bacterium]
MKKLLFILSIGILAVACQKESLELVNPNEPTLETFKTEVGFEKASRGIYRCMRSTLTPTGDWYYFIWFTQWAHNVMGDATVSSVGNFGIRWANQTSQIIRSDATVYTPPTGGSQPQELNIRNSRDFGSDNVQSFEWMPMYSLIGYCNLLLSIVDEVDFSGDEAVVTLKKNSYKAWLYWWKGFAYSRIGSIHSQALIADTYGEVPTEYVDRHAIIDEANRNFILAKDILGSISDDNANYSTIIGALIPSHFQVGKGGIITPSMMTRNINTYMARNILVNKYAADLTTTDLNAIEALANTGMNSTDKTFTVRSFENDDDCFVFQTTWSAYRLNLVWERVSERLIQDFRPGDNRYTRNVYTLATPVVNPSGRGYQYSTRFALTSIDNGGDFMSLTAGLAEIPMACSYEENQLMLAEVKIRRGEVEAGLAHIDNVRNYQNAALAPLVGTGLNQAQALEELRSERRIGLFLKNVAFYDARRWGILKPLSQGGGRTNANVVFTGGVVDNCTIEYNYKEWWDVPANESDFNPVTPAAAKKPGNLMPY